MNPNVVTDDTLQRVFVYGTLKTGYPLNIPWMRKNSARFIATGFVNGLMFHLGAYPAAYYDTSFTPKITGEIWEIPWAGIEDLDAVEGVPNLYERRQVYVSPGIGKAWMYVFSREKAMRQLFIVPQGIWTGPGSQRLPFKGEYNFYKAGIDNGIKLLTHTETQTSLKVDKSTGEILESKEGETKNKIISLPAPRILSNTTPDTPIPIKTKDGLTGLRDYYGTEVA